MREIKFRVWSKSGKQFVEAQTEFHTGEDGIGWLSPPKNLLLMQYTGLKDRNGVEIYEGDIITGQKGESLKNGLYEVVWEQWTNDMECPANGFLVYEPDKCQVVGNVYENPELLK